MIGVVDYGSGNLEAIKNLLKRQGIKHILVDSLASVKEVDRFIFPGVGHFKKTINMLQKKDFFGGLIEAVKIHKCPVLGICVGMQLFSSYSEEGGVAGLDWVPGRVEKFSNDSVGILPHMGWNSISVHHDEFGLFDGIDLVKGFYFLHSYYYVPNEDSCVVASSDYVDNFCCAVTNGTNVFGVQFHPEKSHRNGEILFRNFSEIKLC